MKFIKNRKQYLNEAKIRDVIFPSQAKEVANKWAEKYLDYEEIEPTANIKQGKWLLSEEDKMNVLGKFFMCNMNAIFEVFSKLPEKFVFALEQSVDLSLLRDPKYAIILKDFSAKKPTIDQIIILYESIFRKLAINETRAEEMIKKDENGRPVKDENDQIVKIAKKAGDPVYEKNLVTVNGFIDAYNRCYPDDKVETRAFDTSDFSNLISISKDKANNDFKIDFEIFNRDIYLSISHNPKDILNMSISKFYASCQHLYSGSHRASLLANVFDPNSIPAFLIFDTPIFWNDEKISDFLPLSRMMVRNIEPFSKEEKKDEITLFFDRAYPDRMQEIFIEIIEKYSENKNNAPGGTKYLFTPDVDPEDEEIRDPYMDRLGLERLPYIGVNTKSLNLTKEFDWTKVRISPKAKIKEIVIETNEVPENLFKIELKPDWIKFKYLQLNSMEQFSKVNTDSIGFDKCKFDNNVLNSLANVFPELKKLQLVSCDIIGDLKSDLTNFKGLDELQLIYTLDDLIDLQNIMNDIKVKKLVISGDIASTKEAKSYISSLRQKGTKVEIVGPVI